MAKLVKSRVTDHDYHVSSPLFACLWIQSMSSEAKSHACCPALVFYSLDKGEMIFVDVRARHLLLISIIFSICQCLSLTPFTNIGNRHLIVISYRSSFLRLYILKQIHVFLVDICNHFSLALPEDQNRHITQWKHQTIQIKHRNNAKKKSQETKRKCK